MVIQTYLHRTNLRETENSSKPNYLRSLGWKGEEDMEGTKEEMTREEEERREDEEERPQDEEKTQVHRGSRKSRC